jgi:lysophospholipase L1-like esterase
MQKIFIFGDSIAYGAWDPAGGWVERLRQWLFVTTQGEYNLGTFLYNLSIVGDTTADLLKRFTPEIEARQPGDMIFFAVGINDTHEFISIVVCCASHERRHHRWPVSGSPMCRRAPQNSWI